MSYAAIMVHFDASRQSQVRLRLAVDLAARFQAALIGIAGRSYLPSFLADDIVVDVNQDHAEQREMTAILADLGTKFRAATRQVKNVEWRGLLDYANSLVPLQARAADLVIIGRPADPADFYFALDPGVTIVRAGRPVLLVPDDVESLPARRVVIAWKDCREARRTVQDALPFLHDAKEVMIVEVCEHEADTQSQRRIDDVKEYLLRHKVNVGAKAYLHTKHSVANEVLRFAKDEKVDLIVAGGYGRSRLGEWIFGGVTRELLANSRVCCLFSH
jgi:nucleotide-binding universal stress UspA family protein